ncbi:terminase TerL endonuclease subunit [Sedimentitalea sp.]|uniref:terminase TerL endonuclease subunit n=1 Tax=Sedimentitalea sp. TaxID=2048915 RepID=UPI003296B959
MSTACTDWAERLQAQQVPLAPRLPTPEGERTAAALGRLRLSDKIGKPLLSELPNIGWVSQITSAIFGDANIREAFVLTPKKQGKSALFGLAFFAAFLLDKRPQASWTIVSPTLGISDLVFGLISGAIEADKQLQQRYRVQAHIRTVTNLATGATLVVKSFSLEALTGLRGSVLLDEVHLVGANKNGSKIQTQLKGALAVDPATRIVYVSTQSDTEPKGMFAELLTHARAVRDGTITDDAFLPVLYEPWKDCPDPLATPDVWPCLLPSYPHVGDKRFYEGIAASALRAGPVKAAVERSQFFNVEIGQDQTAETWHMVSALPKLATSRITVDSIIARCEHVAVGIDLGGAVDWTGLGIIGTDADGIWHATARAYAQQKAIDANEHASTCEGFIADGDLRVIRPGADIDAILDIIQRIDEAGKLHAIGVDPAGAVDLVEKLEAASFPLSEGPQDANPVMGIGQSAFRLNPAVRTLERRADEGRIRFDKSRMLRWCFSNCIAVERTNVTEITKRGRDEKFDPVAALLDAASTLILRRQAVFDAACLIG